jgi:hypothetical protein
LHRIRHFLQPGIHSDHLGTTPFSHMKFFWFNAASEGGKQKSKVKMDWCFDLTYFDYSRPGLPKIRISAKAIMSMA